MHGESPNETYHLIIISDQLEKIICNFESSYSNSLYLDNFIGGFVNSIRIVVTVANVVLH